MTTTKLSLKESSFAFLTLCIFATCVIATAVDASFLTPDRASVIFPFSLLLVVCDIIALIALMGIYIFGAEQKQ